MGTGRAPLRRRQRRRGDPDPAESPETRDLAEQVERLCRVGDLLPEHAHAALCELRRDLRVLRMRERMERELLQLARESGALRRAAAEALRQRLRTSLLPQEPETR